MRYPISIQNFEKIHEDGSVYVDKAALVYQNDFRRGVTVG